MKYATITIVFIILAILIIDHTNKVDKVRNNYWESQEQLCHKIGWYSVTGFEVDCRPVKAVNDYLEVK